jgi:hypothetical protein
MKHKADLYSELRVHLRRRAITKTPDQWSDLLYHHLHLMRDLLEEQAGEWDGLTPYVRLRLIRKRIPAPQKSNLVDGAVTAE